MPTNRKFVRFTVESALLKELGERLVGKPQVALAELVKNAYDADAQNVVIRFLDGAIEVVDDGNGMTEEEFSQFWMSVGTTNKQRSILSPTLERQVTGSKGIGRLSVQFLGNSLSMHTLAKVTPQRGIKVEVDWREAQTTGNLVQSGAWVSQASQVDAQREVGTHGTKIRIEGLNQSWDGDALKLLARELWFLRPPSPTKGKLSLKDRFDIKLEGPGKEQIAEFTKQMSAAFSNYIAEINGEIKNGRNKNTKASVTVTFVDGQSFTESYPLEYHRLDNASFRIRIFNLAGRQSSGIELKTAREYFHRYGGVHIYDDKFRLPFYGGDQHDWLRLEKDHSHRLITSKLLPPELQSYGDLRDLPTNSRIFGTVQVSTNSERETAPSSARAKGDYLNIQITRDRLMENEALSDLIHLVRWGIDFYAIRQSIKRQEVAAVNIKDVPPSEPVIDDIRLRVAELRAEKLSATTVSKVEKIAKGLDELSSLERQRKQSFTDEKVLLGALATAGMGAIALEHELGKEMVSISETLDKLSGITDPMSPVTELVLLLRNWIARSTATRRLFSPLMNTDNREKLGEFNAKEIVNLVMKNSTPLLRGIQIDISKIPDDMKFPSATLSAWQAILQNVFVNSINALIDSATKLIVCTGGSDRGGRSFLMVEDNGAGVDLKDAEDLFKPFVRKLEISQNRRDLGLGGAGLGLTIVRMVSESVDCKVEFVEPSSGMSSAFKLSWETTNASQKTQSRHRR